MKLIQYFFVAFLLVSFPAYADISSIDEKGTAAITAENTYRAILGGVADAAVFQESTIPIDGALSKMFMVFNVSVFIVLAWLMFAIMAQKILVAGNDGQIQSNKYNDTMAIIRAGMSLCGLLPIIKGFCLAQVLVVFMGMQASFIADAVNEAGHEYSYTQGATTPYIPDPIKINNTVRTMFDSSACAIAMNHYYSEHRLFERRYKVELVDVSDQGGYGPDTAHFKYQYQNPRGEAICGSVELTINNDKYLGKAGDPTGTWGDMNSHETTHRNRIVEAHKAAVMKTHNYLIGAISLGVVEPGTDVDLDKLSSTYAEAKSAYHKYMYEQLNTSAAALSAEWEKAVKEQFQSDVGSFAAKRGWIYNGFTWVEKSRQESFMSKLTTEVPSASKYDPSYMEDQFFEERFYRTIKMIRASSVNQYKIHDQTNETVSEDIDSHNQLKNLETDQLMQAFYADADWESMSTKITTLALKNIFISTQFNFTDYDPLTNLQHLGYRMINTGFILLGLGSTIDVMNETLAGEGSEDGLARKVVNFVTGGASDAAIRGISKIIEYSVSIMFTISPILIAVGSILAYWLPALPFFMWTLAVLGNYLLVLIAFMAAPLWMAAHAMPEGDGFAGDHARQGWLTMITILARPSIMVMTWHVSLLLMREMGEFTALFLDYAPMANSEALVGLWGSLVMLIIFLIFECVIVYRCTSLIYEVPDQMPIYYGSNNSTANENIGENKGQSIMAGWSSHTQSVSSSALGGMGETGSKGSGGKGKLLN